MDSIYGGRPGSPFVIKARFRSVKEMQKAFQKGPEYKAVWYGEYCIIDTDNKMTLTTVRYTSVAQSMETTLVTPNMSGRL